MAVCKHSSVWSRLELTLSLKKLSYYGHLIKLGLPTLAYRKVRFDMIEIFKVLIGCDCVNEINNKVLLDQVRRTKGH